MKIEITKPGIYNQNGPVKVGTVLDVAKEPEAWRGKYRVIANDADKPLEVATPAPEPEPEPVDDARQHAVAAYQA